MKHTYCYEILLAESSLEPAAWTGFLHSLGRLLGLFSSWRILVRLEHYTLHFYLHAPAPLPASLSTQSFVLRLIPLPSTQATTQADSITPSLRGILFNQSAENLVTLIHRLQAKQLHFDHLELNFTQLFQRQTCTANLHYSPKVTRKNYYYIILPPSVETLLTIDFTKSRDLAYQKVPKYLPTHKILHFLTAASGDALLAVDTFPYAAEPRYLTFDAFDFAKHSLIIGSSGVGKSKFIALFIKQLAKAYPHEYKVVVLDPHDSLKYDLADLTEQKVIDFRTPESAIDIFEQNTAELSVNVELTLGLLKTYFNEGYNGRLERVLRYSLYLLLQTKSFSFANLRRLLLDADFRGQLVAETPDLPTSVRQFFLTDFSELKTGSYNLAIAPIIAFIDEMQMVPLFSAEFDALSLAQVLSENFLTIFSFNRLYLGEQVTQIIAGLLAQQLFLLAEAKPFAEHLIIIVDEVSVVECPILARALSELRKFGASIFLAGQYFHQISPNLRESILANTSNYFIFRSSKTDANILAANLDLKIFGDDSMDSRIELITKLKTRECLVRISHDEKLQPVFRALTTEYVPSETKITQNVITSQLPPVASKQTVAQTTKTPEFSFDLDGGDMSSEQLLISNSTSRKKLPPKGAR